MLSEPERCDNTLINVLVLKKSCLCFSHVSLYRSLPDKLEDYFLLYSIDISVIKVADEALELPERVIVKHPQADRERKKEVLRQAVSPLLVFWCRAEYMDVYGFDAGCPSTGEVNSMCNISMCLSCAFRQNQASERPIKNRSVSKLHTPFTTINRAKLFTENPAMARLQDILRGWGLAVPRGVCKHLDWAKKPWASASQFVNDKNVSGFLLHKNDKSQSVE